MTRDEPGRKSMLEEESGLSWSFLEDERDACAVVSERMELVYLNSAARAIVPGTWFGKRCFEVLPSADEACAFGCPTIEAVHDSSGIVYCEEVLTPAVTQVEPAGRDMTSSDLPRIELGVAVIPIAPDGDGPARAVLLLRPKDGREDAEFRNRLLEDARALRQRVVPRLG